MCKTGRSNQQKFNWSQKPCNQTKTRLCWFKLQLQRDIQQKASNYHNNKNKVSLYREKNISDSFTAKDFTLNECLDWNGICGFTQWNYRSLRVEYYRLYHRSPMGAFLSTSDVAFARCRRSKTDSGFHAVDSALWNCQCMELGFLKKRFSGFHYMGRNALLDETYWRLDLPAISTAVSASNENTACGTRVRNG